MNIALNGLETEIHSGLKKPSQARREIYLIRYADDFIITISNNYNSNEEIAKILENLRKALTLRGVKLNKFKSFITTSDAGFNFLGFFFKTFEASIHHASLGR